MELHRATLLKSCSSNIPNPFALICLAAIRRTSFLPAHENAPLVVMCMAHVQLPDATGYQSVYVAESNSRAATVPAPKHKGHGARTTYLMKPSDLSIMKFDAWQGAEHGSNTRSQCPAVSVAAGTYNGNSHGNCSNLTQSNYLSRRQISGSSLSGRKR